MQHIIRALATPPEGMTASEYARRAGINRSTIHRIGAGTTDPTLASLRELAIVHGWDLDIALRPLSDPDAATAARVLLDGAFADVEPSPAQARWADRLSITTDPVEITAAAGRASAPQHRDGAVYLRGPRDAKRLASAGDASGGRWALSGAAAFAALGAEAPERAPGLLWVEDPERAARTMLDTHRRTDSAHAAHVILAPANDSVMTAAWSVGPLRYVAPMQALLDGFGIGRGLESISRSIAEGWSES